MKFIFSLSLTRNFMIALAFFSLLHSVIAMAGQDMPTLSQISKMVTVLDVAYAPGSIQNPFMAEKAIDEANAAKIELQKWFVQSEIACYEKFFVTSCLNDIKRNRRSNTDILQRIIVEAKALQRLKHIEQLDEQLMEKNLPK
jgi:colicin import membrane protein